MRSHLSPVTDKDSKTSSGRKRRSIWQIIAKRGLKFQIVGWIGMLVNTGVLYLMKGVLGVPLIPASIIAIEMAIVHNFIWHRNWTWKHRIDQKSQPFFQQLFVYNTATGLVDLAVNVSLLWFLTTIVGVYYLISNIIAMILGPIFKFWLNEKVIFRRRQVQRQNRTTMGMKSKRETRERRRTNGSLMSGFEARVLPWMAERLPAWVTPDKLTGLGLISALIIAAGYMLTYVHLAWIWLASFGLIVHWFGDSLDGTLARVRHIERPKYGFFIDHYSDALTTGIITISMGLSPIMDLTVGLSLLAGYLCLSILVYLVTIARGEFKISMGKIGPTEVRMLIIIANTIVFALANPVIHLAGYSMTLFTMMGALVAIGFTLFFLVSGYVERKRMLLMEHRDKVKARRKANHEQTPVPTMPVVEVSEKKEVGIEV